MTSQDRSEEEVRADFLQHKGASVDIHLLPSVLFSNSLHWCGLGLN